MNEQPGKPYMFPDTIEAGELILNITRQFRTPTYTVAGLCDALLQNTSLNRQARENVLGIRNSSRGLLTMLDHLRDFARLNHSDIPHGPFDLKTCLDEAVAVLSADLEHRGIILIVNVDPSLPARVSGQGEWLKQLVIHLVRSGIEISSHGLVTAEIDGSRDGDRICLSMQVHCTGTSDNPLVLRAVTESAYGGPNMSGVETGLVLCRHIVNQVGGEISVFRNDDRQTTFTVTLKLGCETDEPIAAVSEKDGKLVLIRDRDDMFIAMVENMLKKLGVAFVVCRDKDFFLEQLWDSQFTHVITRKPYFHYVAADLLMSGNPGAGLIVMVDPHENQLSSEEALLIKIPSFALEIANVLNLSEAAHAESAKVRTDALKDLKALVVDDNAVSLSIAKGFLKALSLDVDTATGGYEAISRVKSGGLDVVFMDYMMPGINGAEATKTIRGYGGRFQKLPIVALTSNATDETREMFLSEGFSEVVPKPVTLGTLSDLIVTIFKDHTPPEAPCPCPSPFVQDTVFSKPVDGFDFDLALSMMGQNDKLYIKILKIYCRALIEKSARLEALLADDNLDDFTTEIHGLKGSSANVGAVKLSGLFRQMEQAGDSRDIDAIYSLLPALLAEMQRTRESLEAQYGDILDT